MIYFEYGKTKKGYWTNKYLLNQIPNKVLPIMQILYLEYELLFLFDNAISYSIYAKNVLQITQINKKSRDQHPFLCLNWYIIQSRKLVSQKKSTIVINPITSQSIVV